MPIPAALPVVSSSVSSFILSFPCPSVSVLFSVRLGTVPHSLSRAQALFCRCSALLSFHLPMHHLFSKRREFHYPKATSIQQKSRSAPLAVFPLRRKLFCWDFAFLIGKFFHVANPFPLHREFFLLFCQNSFLPMRKIVPGPSILSCADRIARPHIPSWSCPPGKGGLFRDPPDFFVPEGLPSCTYCHGRACPARASPFREYTLLYFTRQHSQSPPNKSRPPGEGCVHYTRSLPRIVRLWQPSMNAQASGGLCPSVYAVRSLYHRIFARQGGSHFQSMSSAVL